MRIVIVLFLLCPLLLNADERNSLETDKIKITLGHGKFDWSVAEWLWTLGVPMGPDNVTEYPVVLDIGLKKVSHIVIIDLNVVDNLCKLDPLKIRKAPKKLYSISFLGGQFTGRLMVNIPTPCVLGDLYRPTKIKFLILVKADKKRYIYRMSRSY